MQRKWMFFLHNFVGIGAMAGGFAAILNPLTPMGITTDALRHGPFTDFLIPGLFLFLFLGVLNLACAILSIQFKNEKIISFCSVVMGGTLCMWILIQCLVMMSVAALHVIFFLIGAVQLALGLQKVSI